MGIGGEIIINKKVEYIIRVWRKEGKNWINVDIFCVCGEGEELVFR